MVAKEKLIPHTSASSSRPGGNYLKRFQNQRPSTREGDYNGYRGSQMSPGSPRSPSGRSEGTSYAESRSDDSEYMPKRPQMTPRRVLHKGKKAPESPKDSSRRSNIIKGPRSMEPDDYTEISELAVKIPRAQRSPRKTPASPRRTKPTTKEQRVEKTSKKVAKPAKSNRTTREKAKAKPLLPGERREKVPTKGAPKSARTAYKPPPVDVIGIQRQPRTKKVPPPMSPTPLAIADAKRKARNETGRRSTIDDSHSIDSGSLRRDKYSLEEDSSTSRHRDPMEQNRNFGLSATEQSESAYDSAYAESAYTDGIYTEGTRDTRDTFDDTVGDTTMGDHTMGESLMGDETFSEENSTKTRSHRGLMARFSSVSENTSFGDGSVMIKQQVAWGCIGLSALQFAILTTQVLLCGIASLSVNPLIGPYPDAFSEWGGKNVYLLVEGKEYFRFITPVFLHVGYLHLLVNACFQLETCAYLEREWGFCTWIAIYLISGVGSCLAASAIDSNVIGVCSSGAMMGLFGARITQAVLWTAFETKMDYMGHGAIIFERLGGVVCSAAVVFVLTFLTYIDWSGHLGGMCTGILAGFFFFTHAIQDPKTRRTLRFLGFLVMLIGGLALAVVLFQFAYYDEELADACNYFRNLYVEGYECECQAFQ